MRLLGAAGPAGGPRLTATDAPAPSLALPRPCQPHGCIVACQIENEMLESNVTTMLRFDFARYMRELAQMARRYGCTVPLLHNDPMLSASFVPGIGGNGMDLYAFDQYITHPPVRKVGKAPWSQAEFAQAIDSIERTVRGYGGGATTGPIIIAELQGGWFNPVRARTGREGWGWGGGAVRSSGRLIRVAACVARQLFAWVRSTRHRARTTMCTTTLARRSRRPSWPRCWRRAPPWSTSTRPTAAPTGAPSVRRGRRGASRLRVASAAHGRAPSGAPRRAYGAR